MKKNYAPLVKEFDLSVFPYWSLAAGFLTGKYREESDFTKSPRGEGVRKYLTPKGRDVLKALDQVSEKHHTQQSTVALAWLLANPLITAPIVSATSAAQLDTLFNAPKLVLDQEDLDCLNKASH
ncbi:aldo/keto reductase [Chryseobacterium sp. P1-3]|uniref:aldo/keto reductase n=1 Tax=Chryseobacterium sp. (strain P1-3) TaxID=1517683 RepID=UPI000AEB4D48|nr:aldo/keto reductase [Chryseobacterium sp. P1-3]